MSTVADRNDAPRRPSRRRQELLAIAAELFAARGFAAVTVDDIGAAAGISGPALYHHFDGKEAMLGEMLVSISEYLAASGHEVSIRSTPQRRVDDLIAMHVDFAVDNPALITIHFRDLIHALPVDQHRIRQRQRQYVETWARALIERGPGTSPGVARAAVHATFGLINSTPFSARLRRSEMVRLLTEMASGALRPVAPEI